MTIGTGAGDGALAPYASRPAEDGTRLIDEPESPTRSAFQRDRDRILHSGAFRKLKYKTQVFVFHEGDYYRTRLTHSLEVAQIARSVARQLSVDEDLAEAVSLAHDLGHTPFGHAGEEALAKCMAPHGGFSHNDQTVRVVTTLEQRYAGFDGLNLTWASLEGVVKHNGPLSGAGAGDREAALPGTVAAVNRAIDLRLDSHAGLEAQIAALADDIAYNTHDIDDGLRARLFTLEDLAAVPLVGRLIGEVNRLHPGLEARRRRHEVIRRLVDRLVTDVITETRGRLEALAPVSAAAVRAAGRPMVGFSEPVRLEEQGLRRFLFERMYRHFQVNRETSRARRLVADLFDLFMAEPNCLPSEWQDGLGHGDRAGTARRVADYIAGMTDRYAMIEHQRLFDLYRGFVR